jgi:arylsulfatase A-like enzyme
VRLVLSLALAAATCRGEQDDGAPRDEKHGAPRHLIVVSIDTLRADALLGEGPRRARTPTLDGVAAGGLAFAGAHAHVPLTLPSHATLLTGRLPPALGLHDNAPFPLRGDVPTLASWLAERGFATDAVVGGQPLARGSGVERGFERFDDVPRRAAAAATFRERDARAVTDAALAAWARDAGGRRRFLFVHYFDPHQPYDPPADCVAGDARDDAARYLGEVTHVDRELARLLAGLRRGGERCLLALLSDHGEGLGDHGERTHGYQLFESTLRVPLLLAELEGDATRPPRGLVAADRGRLVGLVDLLPTLLRELGVAAPEGLDGLALQEPPLADAACYVESLASSLQFGWAQQSGVRGDGATLLRAGAGVPESIDGVDAIAAGESDERLLVDAGAGAPAAERLEAWRAALHRARAGQASAPADAATIAAESLAALGYLGGAADRARHSLAPLDENAALPSPLARRAEIDALLLAVEQLERGDAPGAEAAFTKLLAEDPENRAALFFRGRARVDRRHPQGRDGAVARAAAEDLTSVLAADPSYAGAALLRAKALGLAGEFEAAIASLAQLAEKGESAAVEHLLGALLLERQSAGRANPKHDPERGFACLLRSLELDPAQEGLADSVEKSLRELSRAAAAPSWVALDLARLEAWRRKRPRRRYRKRARRYFASTRFREPVVCARTNDPRTDVLH